MPEVARTLLPSLYVLVVQDLVTALGAWIMNRDSAVKEPFQMNRLWNELTILKGVLIVSSILFLVLAFCPP